MRCNGLRIEDREGLSLFFFYMPVSMMICRERKIFYMTQKNTRFMVDKESNRKKAGG